MEQQPVKAQRQTIDFGESVSVEGYLMPNGEIRYSIAVVGQSLGYSKGWLSRTVLKDGKTRSTLNQMGFSGKTVRVQLESSLNVGFIEAITISEKDFKILVDWAAINKKSKALCLKGVVCNTPSKSSSCETIIQHRIQKQLKGKIEVKTPAGRIDLLTNTRLIEIKEACRWKDAIGQVLIYGHYYPNHIKCIHLFGTSKVINNKWLKLPQKHCDELGIVLTWEIV